MLTKPYKPKSERFSITMPKDLADRVKRLSKDTETAISFVIQIGMSYYLDQLEDESQ